MNNNNNSIAPHETFELHELLTFKNVCATKAASMVNLVQDSELKSLLQQDVATTKNQVKELQNLIQSSEFVYNTAHTTYARNIGSVNSGVNGGIGTTVGSVGAAGTSTDDSEIYGTTVGPLDNEGITTDVNEMTGTTLGNDTTNNS